MDSSLFATPKSSALSLSALSSSRTIPGGSAGSGGSSGASQSILSAYRELQAKARTVEKARAEALHERDELRRQALQAKRHQAIARSRNESQGNEAVLAVRTSCEAVRAAQLDVSARLYAADADLQVKHREMAEQERDLAALEESLLEQQVHHATMHRRNQELEAELEAETRRFEVLQSKHKSLAVQHSAELTHAKDEVNVQKLERQQLHEADSRSRLRAAAMHRYIALVLNVNGDLVSSLQRQTLAAKQLEQFVVLPRYSWPRGQFQSTLNLVTTTATDAVYKLRQRQRRVRGNGWPGVPPPQRLQRVGAAMTMHAAFHPNPAPALFVREGVIRRKTRGKKSKRKTSSSVGPSAKDDYNVGVGVSSSVYAADFLNAIIRQSRENARNLRLAKKNRKQATKVPSYMMPKTF